MLPSSAAIRNQIDAYLADSQKQTSSCIAKMPGNQVFRDIYLAALAAHTVLGSLSTSALRPTLASARSIAVRVPLLVSIGQTSVASGELRRFVELIFWTVYFTDHSVEWSKFLQNRTKGFAQDGRHPITYAAHRQLNSYIEYADELMESEPSGLGAASVNEIKQAVWELNASVHAGRIARESLRVPPHDDVSEASLRAFLKIERRIFSNCCVLVSAYRRGRFNSLNAISRSYFDWLVGQKVRQKIRAGPFGLT